MLKVSLSVSITKNISVCVQGGAARLLALWWPRRAIRISFDFLCLKSNKALKKSKKNSNKIQKTTKLKRNRMKNQDSIEKTSKRNQKCKEIENESKKYRIKLKNRNGIEKISQHVKNRKKIIYVAESGHKGFKHGLRSIMLS